MPDPIVLDTSAALAILLGEPGAADVRAHLVDAGPGRILVLDLFWLELVNVLARRHDWEPDAIVEAIRDLDELGLETVASDRPHLLATLDLAAMQGLSAYDAAHLALAQAAGALVLTLDVRLARAAGDRSVMRPLPGTREEPAPYGELDQPSGPQWARHGRYLADLRQAASAR